METLRLEEEPVVSVTKFQTIDRELSFIENQEPEPLNLPRDDTVERVQRYVTSQHFQEPPPTLSNPAIDPQSHQVNPQVQGTPPKEELNPTANMFTPQPQNCRTGPNPNPNPMIQILYQIQNQILYQLYGLQRANRQQDSEI